MIHFYSCILEFATTSSHVSELGTRSFWSNSRRSFGLNVAVVLVEQQPLFWSNSSRNFGRTVAVVWSNSSRSFGQSSRRFGQTIAVVLVEYSAVVLVEQYPLL